MVMVTACTVDGSLEDPLADGGSTGDEVAATGGSNDEDADEGSSSGDGEIAECFTGVDHLSVGLWDEAADYYSPYELMAAVRETSQCFARAPQVGEDDEGVTITEIVLDCSSDAEAEPLKRSFRLGVRGAAIDLGPEPVHLGYFYELGPNHMWGSEAYEGLSVRRNGEPLVYGSWSQPESLSVVGGQSITGDVPCFYYSHCGLPFGIEGTSPSGEPVQELGGAAVTLAVGERSMLVSVSGVVPQTCPDGLEPIDPLPSQTVGAVDTRLLIPR